MAVAAVFLVITSVAVVLPAYRSVTMDPMVALGQMSPMRECARADFGLSVR